MLVPACLRLDKHTPPARSAVCLTWFIGSVKNESASILVLDQNIWRRCGTGRVFRLQRCVTVHPKWHLLWWMTPITHACTTNFSVKHAYLRCIHKHVNNISSTINKELTLRFLLRHRQKFHALLSVSTYALMQTVFDQDQPLQTPTMYQMNPSLIQRTQTKAAVFMLLCYRKWNPLFNPNVHINSCEYRHPCGGTAELQIIETWCTRAIYSTPPKL